MDCIPNSAQDAALTLEPWAWAGLGSEGPTCSCCPVLFPFVCALLVLSTIYPPVHLPPVPKAQSTGWGSGKQRALVINFHFAFPIDIAASFSFSGFQSGNPDTQIPDCTDHSVQSWKPSCHLPFMDNGCPRCRVVTDRRQASQAPGQLLSRENRDQPWAGVTGQEATSRRALRRGAYRRVGATQSSKAQR